MKIALIPEKRFIEKLPANGADQAFHKGMRDGNPGHGLDGIDLEHAKVGFPLVEFEEGIMIGAEMPGARFSLSDQGKHLADGDSIRTSLVNGKSHDFPRELVHDQHYPVRFKKNRFTAKEIQRPKGVLCFADQFKPGGAAARRKVKVPTENPAHDVLVDELAGELRDEERDSRAAIGGIFLFDFEHQFNDFFRRAFGAGLAAWGRKEQGMFLFHESGVKFHQAGMGDYKGQTWEPTGANKKGADPKDQAIEGSEVRGAFSFTLHSKELLAQKNVFCGEVPSTVPFRQSKPEQCEVQKKEENGFHGGNGSENWENYKSVKIDEKMPYY